MNKILTIFFSLTIITGFFLFSCQDHKIEKISKIEKQTQICPRTKKDTSNFVYPNPKNNTCLTCHTGVAHIRDPKSGMMQEIYAFANLSGFKDNECIVCHGGNPESTNKKEAHKGTIKYFKENKGPKEFYPNPSSVWVNENTCGICHQEEVKTQFTSLMFTEAGKIQGATWAFGANQSYEHNVANLPVEEVKVHERLGTKTYKKYMAELKKAEPQVYPGKMKGLPEAPTPEEIEKNPSLSVYSYLRADCQRCHTGVKGHNAYGDFRGAGCASCHIPYSNKGLYEGNDGTIDRKKTGKMLVHSIQSTRDAKVTVHGKTYTGMPTKTCTSCHNRGRRIGVSYEGLMETSYSSPFMGDGGNQQKIHKKNYIHLQSDVHLKKGMLCQDCHTSGDMHSMGDLAGTVSAAVEIECQDCHGTPEKFPWELPIGYGDEIASEEPKQGAARGLIQELPDYLKKGSEDCKRDGYLISSRGNPMPHIVKTGDSLILYSASGKNITLQPLKKLTLENKLSLEGKVAMTQIHSHIDKMECYACHATWAPQCYGCHVNIDYSNPKLRTDWIKVAEGHQSNGQTVDALSKDQIDDISNYLTSGDIQEQRSYLRWEDPPLVINGEHRVSPAIPGCQVSVSVKNAKGETKLLNHIFKVQNVHEGGGKDGQLSIDMAPLHPHTVQKKARTCESCHTNPKAMGYGINNGDLYVKPDSDIVMDLTDIDGKPIANQFDTVFNRIENLNMDWSRFLDEDGHQLQTVGHHFSGSRPLNKEELSKLDRRGVCISCHKTIPEGDLAGNLMSHVAKYAKIDIDNKEHQSILNKSIRLSAWVQIILPFLLLLGAGLWWRRKKKK